MPKTILIAALNWGLGHATRSIPLIYAAQKRGFRLILAADGAAGILLKSEFPKLEYIELPSYHISYPFGNIVTNILYLLPRIMWAVVSEFFAVRRIVKRFGVNAIVSDNRYGVFTMTKTVKTVFLGHQLNIKLDATTETLTIFEKIIALTQGFYLNLFFDAVAIPDAAHETQNLAGVLCHNKAFTKYIQYIYTGILSRFSLPLTPSEGGGTDVLSAILRLELQGVDDVLRLESLVADDVLRAELQDVDRVGEGAFESEIAFLQTEAQKKKQKNCVLVLLSGPEPQRTVLEQKILTQAADLPLYQFTIVCGTPKTSVFCEKIGENITRISHLYTNYLREVIHKNDLIICRSGYSTLMDLAFFNEKKLILIPTHGQTEQIYLANRLARNGRCVVQNQADLDLKLALKNIENIDFFEVLHSENTLEDLLDFLSE